MAFSDTLPVFIYTSFTPWSLSFYPSPLNFFFPSCRLSYFCLPAFTLLLPLVHYSSLPSIRPLILFTGIGLELISPAGCICYRCSALSQQMCINRPSGVVIANKDPVCVCMYVQKRWTAAMNACMGASSPKTTQRGDKSASPSPRESLCSEVVNETGRPPSLGLDVWENNKKSCFFPCV